MKVFYVLSDACSISGGAERAAIMVLRRLRDHYDFECEMLSSHPLPFEQMRDGIRLRGFRDIEELKTITRMERPDIIVGSLEDAVPAFKVACHFGIPRILTIHSYEYSPPTAEEVSQWSLSGRHRSLPQTAIDFVLDGAGHIFVCSQYMQQFLCDRTGRRSEVLLNDWDEADVLIDACDRGEGACITAICGHRYKGVEIFLELARRFPDERFLLVGEPGGDIALRSLDDAVRIPNLEMPGRQRPREFLARSKLVLMPSQWPEPFGRIAVEALVNGTPVLASRTGGLCEIVGDGPMGVDDFSNIDEWTRCLQAQVEGHRIAAADLDDAQDRARAFLSAEPVHRLADVIQSLTDASSPGWKSTQVAFNGGLDDSASHALVNAAWSQELTARGYQVGATGGDGFGLPDQILMHDYSSDFNDFQSTETGHNIAIRTSDFGPYPESWVDKLDAEFDQLWVYTEWIAEQALASGIDPDLVKVVPLGVDQRVFCPDGPGSALVPHDRFTFLFVGGAVLRKGIDILIKAYRSAFSSSDDVTLVIKGDSSNACYKDLSDVENALTSGDGNGAPEVLHIDAHLDVTELAAIYRSCDVGVFPYRAEGFVLPIAEAMACGTPSVVPEFGPCLDFCSASTSFFVPARRVKLPFQRNLNLALGFSVDLAAVDFCEVRVDALAQVLRSIYDAGRAGLTGRQEAGINVVRERLTWASSVDHVEECLREMRGTVPRRILARRAAAAKEHRRAAAVYDMAIELALDRVKDRHLQRQPE